MNDKKHKSREALLADIEALKQQVADLKGREQTLQDRVRTLEAQQEAQIRVDQEIIRIERLRALEDMAQGVAHNFNNVLVGILGYAQIIEMQSKEAQVVENAKKIVENTLRAKELVQRLYQSVRDAGDLPLRRITTLNAIVREAIKTTQPKNPMVPFAIVEDLHDDIPSIKGNSSELHHVLVHLLTNAIDAMPKGGEIAVSTRAEKERVAIHVKDQGIGMTKETRKRIFEPFFTTKQDVGSGLGLAMAYRVITGWGGSIDVESTVGKGSMFTVWLPIWSDVPEAQAEKARILIVDDEIAVHEVLKAALEAYHLTLFESGEAALETFEAGMCDLALIDLQLPGMPGDELVQHLKRIDPDLTSILMTGWELMQGDPRLNLFSFYLPKPFQLGAMAETIRQALDAHKKGLATKRGLS